MSSIGAGGGTRVFTDGACRGNPGPGGWAWAVESSGAGGSGASGSAVGSWASGHDPDTTNQRMEILAVLEAARSIRGPLTVVSDSTYVVHCWRDSWWKGWLARDWRNSQRKPVANRDLWEPLVEVFRSRGDFSMEWVKGHGGDPMNDLVDRLAVAASYGRVASGEGPPPTDLLDAADSPGPASVGGSLSGVDPRIPAGWRLVVTGVHQRVLGDRGVEIEAKLTAILAAQREMHPDVVVLTGLRPGSEAVAATAATGAGVPYVAVLPYPDPLAGRPEVEQAAFSRLTDAAVRVVTLERRRPLDLEGRRSALQRRDGWLRSVADAAIVVTDGHDPDSELALRRFEAVLGDGLWDVSVPEA